MNHLMVQYVAARSHLMASHTTERLDFVELRRKYTIRYEEYIYERVKELTVEQVSRNEQLTSEQVSQIFHRVAQKKKDWGTPQRLSLDEFSCQKGKRDFVTVVSDIDKVPMMKKDPASIHLGDVGDNRETHRLCCHHSRCKYCNTRST